MLVAHFFYVYLCVCLCVHVCMCVYKVYVYVSCAAYIYARRPEEDIRCPDLQLYVLLETEALTGIIPRLAASKSRKSSVFNPYSAWVTGALGHASILLLCGFCDLNLAHHIQSLAASF